MIKFMFGAVKEIPGGMTVTSYGFAIILDGENRLLHKAYFVGIEMIAEVDKDNA